MSQCQIHVSDFSVQMLTRQVITNDNILSTTQYLTNRSASGHTHHDRIYAECISCMSEGIACQLQQRFGAGSAMFLLLQLHAYRLIELEVQRWLGQALWEEHPLHPIVHAPQEMKQPSMPFTGIRLLAARKRCLDSTCTPSVSHCCS